MSKMVDSMTLRSNTHVLTTGFVALDVVRVPGSAGAMFAAGGSCGNVSANLAALGIKTFPVIVVGADEEGRTVYEDLAASGVQLQFIQQRPDLRTPVVIHDVLEPGVFGLDHRFVLEAPSTGTPLPRYASIAISDVDRVISSGIKYRLLYFDRLSRAILELARWAKANGAFTFFEPSQINDTNLFFAAQPHVDIIKFSAQRISPTDELLQRLNNPVRIITRGSAGLTLKIRGENGSCREFDLPAENPTTVVDSAGAGDAVSTGLICSLVPHDSGLPFEEQLVKGLQAGQKLAALNCSFVGARGIFRALRAQEISEYMYNGASGHLAFSKRQSARKPTLDWTTKPSLEERYG
jgi:fructokinase